MFKYQACNAIVKMHVYNKIFFMFILYVSMLQLSHDRGMRPFKTEKRFGSMLIPTLWLLLFVIKNCVCLDIKIRSKFRLVQSSDGVEALYNLCNWIAILYVIKDSGIALLFILWYWGPTKLCCTRGGVINDFDKYKYHNPLNWTDQ